MGLLKLEPPKALRFLKENVKRNGNLMGLNRWEWARELDLPRSGDKLFFSGCGYQHLDTLGRFLWIAHRTESWGLDWEATWGLWDKVMGLFRPFIRGRGNALKDAVKVLREEGLELAYLYEDEPCCGGALYFSGFWGDFEERIPLVIDSLQKSGAREILVMVPSCAYVLKELCRVPYEVLTFPEFFLRHRRYRRRMRRPLKVVYHDPCMLSRWLGVIEEPREVLRGIEGVELLEAERSREWSECCGGGGGFELVFPFVSKELAKNRALELLKTGAEVVVTSCPGCLLQVKAGVQALGSKVEVLDLAEFLARSELCV